MWQKSFSDGAKWEPEASRCLLLRYLEELDKFIDERAVKYGELRIKESEVQAIKEIENWLKEKEIQQQESLVTEGTTLEACLVTEVVAIEACLITEAATLEACLLNEGIALNDNTGVMESSGTKSENSSSETPSSRPEDENRSSDKESSSSEGNDATADIGPSFDNDTVIEAPDVGFVRTSQEVLQLPKQST
ncbi:hypothetical protein Tco_1455607 [Tanacetum coccineum]